MYYRDKFKISPTHNTDGWGNKLVTIFANYTRTNIMTKEPSNILVNLLAAGGQDSVKSGLITCTMMAKIAPWWLAAGTTIRLKYRDRESADCATNVYSLNRRAVRFQAEVPDTAARF